MAIKKVKMFQAGRLFKTFECDRCDISAGALIFFGCYHKDGKNQSDWRTYFRDEIYFDVNHAERLAFVQVPTDRDPINIFITW